MKLAQSLNKSLSYFYSSLSFSSIFLKPSWKDYFRTFSSFMRFLANSLQATSYSYSVISLGFGSFAFDLFSSINFLKSSSNFLCKHSIGSVGRIYTSQLMSQSLTLSGNKTLNCQIYKVNLKFLINYSLNNTNSEFLYLFVTSFISFSLTSPFFTSTKDLKSSSSFNV